MKAKIEKLQVRYCKFGCNQALNVYVNEWRKRIGSPAAPELVAGSLTNVSLILKWEKHSEASNISYLVQLQNVSLNSDWLYYRPERTFSFSRAHVKDLHPYTKYRFRVAWIIHPQFPPVFSLPSLEIVTAAYGEPSTPPVITSLVATGPTHISVSWEPPPYPNGPLIAYMLYLFEGSNTTHAKTVKEISLSQFFNTTSNNSTDQINQSSRMHHIFSDLKEGTLYTVSVSCVNTEGEGPSANESVATLNSTSDSENFEKAYAVIASDKSVSLVPIDFMSVADKLFRLSDYSSNDSIISIAVHVAKNLLFVSDTNACVRRVSFEDNENIKTQTILKSKTNSISKLSVDWLNDMLYLLEGSNICRCNLNGRSKHIVVTGFKEKVYDMHVDPYNGYLYWSYSDFFESGIYRIDISRFQTSPVRYREAECIYKDQQFITVFTIDYSNFRLYFPTNRLSEENTIISLTLSGIDSIDIRKNKVVTPQFNFVNSVVYFNETFYWTVGHEVYKEEYHNESNIFYHNSHTLGDDYYGDVRILHSRMQPYPLPHNTVEKLEAIFSETIAKVSWKKPALLGGMAQGAWQRWTYDIAIEELSSYNVTEIENINQTSCVLEQLKTNTTYKISVRASSAAGKGPWSAAFIGTTLNKNNNNVPSPYILWTTKRGLFRSNMIGDEIELLFDAKKFNYSSMKDIAFYNDLIFLNVNDSSIFNLNLGNKTIDKLLNVSAVKSIAIDWLAPKLYWSNPSNRVISRSNLDGSQIEIIRFATLAKDIAIDSLEAKLFWITDYFVECSLLNGQDHRELFKVEPFSGKQIIGLTLNHDHKEVYWIVRESNDFMLYKLDLLTGQSLDAPNHFLISSSDNSLEHVHGSLWYFDQRFFLHYHKSVLVTDLKARNVAFLRPTGLRDVETIEIVDESARFVPYLDEMDLGFDIVVVPNPVNASSIRINGNRYNVTFKWDPIENVNYGEIFYEISVTKEFDAKITEITKNTHFRYEVAQESEPISRLRVYIKSMTYWASSASTIVDWSPTEPISTPITIDIRMTNETVIMKAHYNIKSLILYSGIILVCILILLFVCCLFQKVKHEGDEKKVLRDADLVQLPELPSHHHENNAHYFSGDAYMDEELSSIPQLAASQIKLNKFLGSGAFADVYEGIIYNFNDENSIKVAIKTLRNGASESQKNDFLKEAKLMKNFKHRHILQLLAICLDNSPILIFELMEGGDLLSYLRKNRPDVGKNSSLTMNDLLNISIDVAKGCKYLEEMHYVHRDLATRNCLVSSYLRCQRVVKIGDFGLARDIYKHDYYRKDGEGLLPVRWMAPESIVDGIFTTQSDIWSFGVLLWEVLTLGQRPYPARDNVEVLNFVKSGGRLEIPKNCPNQLVKLLKQCWHHQPENRPTFGSCLKRLEQIRSNLAHLNVVITSINNQSYALQSGFDNPGYKEDESLNSSLDNSSKKPAAQPSTSAAKYANECTYPDSSNTNRSPSAKYLKLLASKENTTTDNDGYEIPLFAKQISERQENGNNNCDDSIDSSQIRRKHHLRNCSPPPTYSQIFSASQRTTLNEPDSNNGGQRDSQRDKSNSETYLVTDSIYSNGATSSENSDDTSDAPSVTAALLKAEHNSFNEAPSRNINGLRLNILAKRHLSKYHNSLPCICAENENLKSKNYSNALHLSTSSIKASSAQNGAAISHVNGKKRLQNLKIEAENKAIVGKVENLSFC